MDDVVRIVSQDHIFNLPNSLINFTNCSKTLIENAKIDLNLTESRSEGLSYFIEITAPVYVPPMVTALHERKTLPHPVHII